MTYDCSDVQGDVAEVTPRKPKIDLSKSMENEDDSYHVFSSKVQPLLNPWCEKCRGCKQSKSELLCITGFRIRIPFVKPSTINNAGGMRRETLNRYLNVNSRQCTQAHKANTALWTSRRRVADVSYTMLRGKQIDRGAKRQTILEVDKRSE